ncbi:MAG: hypothetical protein AB7E09_07365 [Candidatus Izemoplasmatales bacterium]|uniref:FeoB-associated Cys-rich membrane protein n=1 Tax=Hujiaoplasma nucleasis TaxID=2725268 RepID=A0A7L6N184_9MOLU|nr:hypothetical protein [Hujiaoplasma nucleasis]QLY40020.1 hypothetical protein HF295_03760 [Hujiaoplasma nucleasis]
MEIVYGILIIVAIVGLYFWSYSANEKCDKPEGAEDLECKSCHASHCSSRKNEFEK